jgi:hypothetical protein
MVENAPATGRLRLLAELRIHADIAELELLFGRETPGALEQYRSLILRGQLAHAMHLTIHIVGHGSAAALFKFTDFLATDQHHQIRSHGA